MSCYRTVQLHAVASEAAGRAVALVRWAEAQAPEGRPVEADAAVCLRRHEACAHVAARVEGLLVTLRVVYAAVLSHCKLGVAARLPQQ